MKIFECVPNVSDGRDAEVIDACARAIVAAGAGLAHRTSDARHDRSVFTFFGAREPVIRAIAALAEVTVRAIDLRTRRGAHPRIGALDVVPIVPFGDATVADAIDLARDAARRIWSATGVPVYYYGAAASIPQRVALPDVRRGEFEALAGGARRDERPDVGDLAAHASAGAIAIGVREPLIAFNVVLATDDVALARRIAGTIRERGGGLRGVRALGIALDDATVQVSCNFTDPNGPSLALAVERIASLAAERGVAVARSELIGLVPRAALAASIAHAFGIEPAEVPLARTQ